MLGRLGGSVPGLGIARGPRMHPGPATEATDPFDGPHDGDEAAGTGARGVEGFQPCLDRGVARPAGLDVRDALAHELVDTGGETLGQFREVAQPLTAGVDKLV